MSCRRGRESSAGRLTHPPHSMWVVEACSAAAARLQCGWLRCALPPRHAGRPLSGLTVDRILPRYTVQTACATSAQSPSAALNGYDSTTPFHQTAYAFSYTARSATRQATPQVTPWRRFDKTRHGYAGRRIPTGRARKSRNEISFACNAIMSVQYVILYYIVGPTCRGLNNHVHASLEI